MYNENIHFAWGNLNVLFSGNRLSYVSKHAIWYNANSDKSANGDCTVRNRFSYMG